MRACRSSFWLVLRLQPHPPPNLMNPDVNRFEEMKWMLMVWGTFHIQVIYIQHLFTTRRCRKKGNEQKSEKIPRTFVRCVKRFNLRSMGPAPWIWKPEKPLTLVILKWIQLLTCFSWIMMDYGLYVWIIMFCYFLLFLVDGCRCTWESGTTSILWKHLLLARHQSRGFVQTPRRMLNPTWCLKIVNGLRRSSKSSKMKL